MSNSHNVHKNVSETRYNAPFRHRNVIQKTYKIDDELTVRTVEEKRSFFSYFKTVEIIFAFVIVFALVVGAVRGASGRDFPTFYGLLNMFSSAPQISISMSYGSSLGDWGILNGLRDGLVGAWNVVSFFVTNIINMIVYFAYFVQWIFA